MPSADCVIRDRRLRRPSPDSDPVTACDSTCGRRDETRAATATTDSGVAAAGDKGFADPQQPSYGMFSPVQQLTTNESGYVLTDWWEVNPNRCIDWMSVCLPDDDDAGAERGAAMKKERKAGACIADVSLLTGSAFPLFCLS